MARKRDGVKTDVDVFDLEIGGEPFVVMSLPVGHTVPADGLTKAEVEVVRDAVSGLSSAAIAKRRGTSARTIANQLAAIYRKLGVTSRAELAVLMLERT